MQTSRFQEIRQVPPLSSIINIDDFETVAGKALSPEGWAYYTSGADDERTKDGKPASISEIALPATMLENGGNNRHDYHDLGRRPICLSKSIPRAWENMRTQKQNMHWRGQRERRVSASLSRPVPACKLRRSSKLAPPIKFSFSNYM
jgi:hypothetical protein